MNVNTYLRRFGFEIKSRPAKGPALWEDTRTRRNGRTGRVMPECDAWTVAMRREAAQVATKGK